jgi:glutaconate CoA-transferase, subunit A
MKPTVSGTDKRIPIAHFIELVSGGGVIAFGGGGLQRKPMLAASAIGRSGLENLEIVSFLGGPEVDLLIGLGKVRRLLFAFVGFDALGLAPRFRVARESGALEIVEYSEGLMLAALEAAAKRLPFLPSRFGLGTDLFTTRTCPLKTFHCPVSGELLVAVPALAPDFAVIHANEADRHGNALIHGDVFADVLLAQSSNCVVVTAERVVDRLSGDYPGRSTFVSRLWVDHVIEAPGGGGVSSVYPDYRFDLPRLVEYQERAMEVDALDILMTGESP